MNDPTSQDVDIAQAVVDAGRSLRASGLISGTAGNLSARTSSGAIVVTPSGADKGSLSVNDLVHLRIDEPEAEPTARASVELPFHLAAYHANPSVEAVVHTHAPALTAIGLRGVAISDHLPELAVTLGGITRIGFHPSGSRELADSVGIAVREGASLLILERHGAVSVGATIREALHRMELAELSAYSVLLALDGSVAINPERKAKLEAACALLRPDAR